MLPPGLAPAPGLFASPDPLALPAVAQLYQHADHTGIDDLPILRTEAGLVQRQIKTGKELFPHLSLAQMLAERPDGGGVRRLACGMQAGAAGKGVRVRVLGLQGLIRELVERLEDQRPEEHNQIMVFGAGRGFSCFFVGLLKKWTELLPVDGLTRPDERVSCLIDALEPGMAVGKSELMHAASARRGAFKLQMHR